MRPENDEQRQIERFRQGDPEAFDDLYDTYGPRLYQFGLRLCGKPADAEDLKQDVFVAAYNGLHRFEGRSSLTTYLFRIALYRWGQMRGGKRPETVRWENAYDGYATTPDPAPLSHFRIELLAALEKLSDAQRTALLLVKVDGFTHTEAAQMLSVPVGTVKYRVHEALQRLRALMDTDPPPAPIANDPPALPPAKPIPVQEVVKSVMDYSEVFANIEEAESVLGVPVLGSLPMISEPGLRLLQNVHPFSPVMESYRSLRIHLRFRKETPPRAIAVASSVPMEGKSTVASNLAIAYALEKKRVVIVDADLRRPMQHKHFNLGATAGLAEILAGTHTIDAALQPTGVENLTLIPAGSPPLDPSEKLGSPAMEQLLDDLKQRFDVVLIDTSPALVVADICAFAHATDGVLLVLAAGDTKKKMAQRTMEVLGRCRAEVLGTVMNRMPMAMGYSYSSYYSPTETGDSPRPKTQIERPRVRRKNTGG